MIQQDMSSSIQSSTTSPVREGPPPKPTPNPGVDADSLRTRFVQHLSDMYRAEVPLYGDLVDIVRTVDASVLALKSQDPSSLPIRYSLERHGAIRLGTAQEIRLIARLFRIMGMHPVGYYDLQIVGFPLHGTAFRPTSKQSLDANPFRVFTTVLRPSLITSPTVRETAESVLSKRQLFSPRLIELMETAETTGLLTEGDVGAFISEALKIFKWHSRSTVPLSTYLGLLKEHPMVADIVCFPSAHINHLTPRTLDIDAVQEEMIHRGLPAKECIEGPPAGRKCEILLRQTSFKALEERVKFAEEKEEQGVNGTHTARFGEVEQRGAAVTRKGRELYDRLLASAMRMKENGRNLDDALKETFAEYPDDWETLRRDGLVFFRYRVAKPGVALNFESGIVQMEDLLQAAVVECEPITYEDFLPLSAAGIFASNLGDDDRKLQNTKHKEESRAELETVLGQSIPCEMDMYDELQAASVKECEKVLGLRQIVFAQ